MLEKQQLKKTFFNLKALAIFAAIILTVALLATTAYLTTVYVRRGYVTQPPGGVTQPPGGVTQPPGADLICPKFGLTAALAVSTCFSDGMCGLDEKCCKKAGRTVCVKGVNSSVVHSGTCSSTATTQRPCIADGAECVGDAQCAAGMKCCYNDNCRYHECQDVIPSS